MAILMCYPPPSHFFPSLSLHTDCSANTNKYTHKHTCRHVFVAQSIAAIACCSFSAFTLLPSSLATCQIGKPKVKQQQPQQQPQTQDIAEAKQTLTPPAKFR